MTALAPILDWLEENSPRFQPPRPLDPKLRAMLESRGLPDSLIGLVAFGSQAPAAMPRCSARDRHTLSAPGQVEAVPAQDGWDLGGWLGRRDGTLQQLLEDDELGPVRSMDQVLGEHLDDLRGGRLEWHETTGCFVDLRHRHDLRWIDTIPTREPRRRVRAFADRLQEQLPRGSAEFSGFGSFSISTRRAFDGFNPKTGRPMRIPARAIPVFRADPAFQAYLAGQVQDPPGGTPVIRALQQHLHRREPVGVPGAGGFTLSVRRAFPGRDATGAAIEVPAARIAVFRSWQTLTGLLNPN